MPFRLFWFHQNSEFTNSFRQNKIGHEFCLPKTDSSKFTLSMKNQPTLFKTCNLYSRHRKVSIPASSVSNNKKPGFHIVVPQLQHPNSQARRLLGGHGCKNPDIPHSQFSKPCKCSDHNDHHGVSSLMSQNHEITKLHRCHRITRSQTCTYSIQIVHGNLTNHVNAPNLLQRHCQCLTTATMTATTTNSSRTKLANISPEYSHPLSR